MHRIYFDIISGRSKGPLGAVCRFFLLLLSGLYRIALLFAPKPSYRPKARTISIGNIVAGGTGKTPFTIFLANQLSLKTAVGDAPSAQSFEPESLAHGGAFPNWECSPPCASDSDSKSCTAEASPTAVFRHSVGILVRGYKAGVEHAKVPFMFQREAPVSLVGDEALLIAKNVPEAKIYCSKNKVASAQMADGAGCQYLLIDDGFQHTKLIRDVDIVMLDAENPFGYGHLLPRGLLREPLSALSRADLIVITSRNGHDFDESVIREYSQAPICKVRFSPQGIFDLQGKEADTSVGTKVGIFCAIAKPEQFAETIGKLGLEIVYSKFLNDHDSCSASQLEEMFQEAKKLGARALITTEKDMVKISGSRLPIYWLKIGIEMMTPGVWEEFFRGKIGIFS